MEGREEGREEGTVHGLAVGVGEVDAGRAGGFVCVLAHEPDLGVGEGVLLVVAGALGVELTNVDAAVGAVVLLVGRVAVLGAGVVGAREEDGIAGRAVPEVEGTTCQWKR